MIIGIAGKKRTGKNTIASFIKSYACKKDMLYSELNFAYPIKTIIYSSIGKLLNLSFDDIDGKTALNRDEFIIDKILFKSTAILAWARNYPNSNINLNKINNLIAKINKFTIRRLMQFIGSDVFDNKLLWTDILEKEINKKLMKNPNILITISDCRFSHEVEMIRKFNKSFLIYVERPYLNYDEHISEMVQIDEYEYKLINNDPDILHQDIERILFKNIIDLQ